MLMLTKNLFRSNTVTVFVMFAAAALISALAYPEIFLTFKTSFVVWFDYCVDYPLTFVLTNFLYQGGLQLWNVFGQMPFVHTYGVEGLFKLPNIVTAITYYFVQPFAEDSGRLFHHVFAWSNLMTLLFVRIVGIYLLLKTVTEDRRILTVGTIIFAVFFSQFAFLRGQFYMSCFPLGMYFIVRFFQGLQWRYLLAVFLFFILCLGSGVLHGAYLYLPLHFFMIAGIVWRIFFYARTRNDARVRLGSALPWRKIAASVLIAVLVLAPYLFIVKFGFADVAFDQTHSRISHMFSPQWYFQTQDMDTRLYFQDILNMQTVMTTYSLYYAGWMFLVLALMGIIFSRNTLKWFFVFGFILLWLLGLPREQMNPGVIAHWINVLTNPLKTIPRSYQNACQPMLPFLLMPLAAMGIEVVIQIFRGKKYSSMAFIALGAFVAVLALANVYSLPLAPKMYLIVCTALLAAGMVWVHFKDSARARIFFAGSMCALMLTDIMCVIYQTKQELIARC